MENKIATTMEDPYSFRPDEGQGENSAPNNQKNKATASALRCAEALEAQRVFRDLVIVRML